MALLDNLVSYWKLNEASGTAFDAHSTNDLGDNNAVGSATGKISNGRDFESGSAQFFSLASNSELQTGDVDFTLTCWVKMESNTGTQQMVTKFSDTSGEYALIYDGNFFKFYCGSNAIADSTLGVPAVDTWYFIAAWFNSGSNEISINVNNGPVDTAVTTPVAAGAATFMLGNRQDQTQYLDGMLDEVGFWKGRVLTIDERTALYNGGNGLSYDDFIEGEVGVPQILTVFNSPFRQRYRLIAYS